MLEKAFSAIDLFGIPILLNFSRSQKAQSSFGGFCSLIFGGFIIWAIYNSGYELFARKNPQIVAGNTYSDTLEQIDISSRELPFMFTLKINDVFDPNFCRFNYAPMNDQGQTGTFRAMEICTTDSFDPSFGVQGDVSIYRCLPSSPEVPKVTSFVVFMNCPFQNFTAGDFISNPPVAILLYPLQGLTLNSYKNPVQYYFDFDFLPLASNTTFINRWSLTHLSITTDDAWLTTNENIEQYIGMESQLNRNVQNNQGTFVSYVFNVSNQQTYYLRSYKKIQNVLAEVGGIASTVFSVLAIVVLPYAKIKFSEAFVNELFETQGEKPDKTRNTQESKLEKENYNHNKTHKVRKLKNSQKQSQNNKQRWKTYNVIPENESKSGISQKRKANEDISKAAQYENEGLLLQNKYDAETPDECISSYRKAHTEPILSEPWPRLENNKQNDGNNDYDNVNIGGIELVLPAKSHSNYKKHDKYAINIKEEKQGYEDPPKDSKNEELVVEEGDLQLQNQDIIEPDKNKQSYNKNKNKVLEKVRKESSKPKRIKSEGITISLLEYVGSFVSKSKPYKEKMTVLNEGIKIMDERLDMLTLIKKLRDVDKMKGLILNKDQRFLFDRTSLPEIMSRANYWYTEDNLSNDELFGGGTDLIKDAQKRLENKSQKSEIDKKLISLFSKSEED